MEQRAVQEFFTRKLGNDWVRTPLGLWVKVDGAAIVQHILRTGGWKQVMPRLQALSLLRPTLQAPYEVWLSFEKRTPRWALKFIGVFRDEKMRPYLSVVAFSRRGILLEPIVYTAYRTRLSQIDSKRVGWLLYGK